MPKRRLTYIITKEQIDIMIRGIEDGYTIDQCCKELLHMASRTEFYKYATKEQKAEIKAHKILHSSLNANYLLYNKYNRR